MKVLILGATGMLGHKLVQVLSERYDTTATMRGRLSDTPAYSILQKYNILEGLSAEDISGIEEQISKIRPDVVINAIGVIKQLPSSKEVVSTLRLNSIFPQLLAALGKEYGFRLITISTDCVFLGTKGNYTEDDVPDALDLYGRSKQYGEVHDGQCLTLRTSIIGRELTTSHSLIDWFLSNKNGSVKGFSRAIYSGFPTIVLSEIIAMLIADFRELNGLYQVSSEPISKLDLLELVRIRTGIDITINRDDEFAIDRSLNSDKFKNATGYSPLGWPEMVDRMFSDPTPYSNIQSTIL